MDDQIDENSIYDIYPKSASRYEPSSQPHSDLHTREAINQRIFDRDNSAGVNLQKLNSNLQDISPLRPSGALDDEFMKRKYEIERRINELESEISQHEKGDLYKSPAYTTRQTDYGAFQTSEEPPAPQHTYSKDNSRGSLTARSSAPKTLKTKIIDTKPKTATPKVRPQSVKAAKVARIESKERLTQAEMDVPTTRRSHGSRRSSRPRTARTYAEGPIFTKQTYSTYASRRTGVASTRQTSIKTVGAPFKKRLVSDGKFLNRFISIVEKHCKTNKKLAEDLKMLKYSM